jgi:hypothetical protein
MSSISTQCWHQHLTDLPDRWANNGDSSTSFVAGPALAPLPAGSFSPTLREHGQHHRFDQQRGSACDLQWDGLCLLQPQRHGGQHQRHPGFHRLRTNTIDNNLVTADARRCRRHGDACTSRRRRRFRRHDEPHGQRHQAQRLGHRPRQRHHRPGGHAEPFRRWRHSQRQRETMHP